MASLLSDPPEPGVVAQAKQKYPILRQLDVRGVSSPGARPYMLEFWGKGDPGSEEEPRPKGIPEDAIGVQVFDDKTRPIDVLADVVSHHLRESDPTIKKAYSSFVQSLNTQQKARLHEDYEFAQRHGGTQGRDFEQWTKQVRLPAYFRGYTFDQWSPAFNKKVFTPDQIKIFDKVRSYLGITGTKPQGPAVSPDTP